MVMSRIAAVSVALLLTAGAAEAQVKVKVASSQTLGEAPFYVAIEKGHFTAEGLDVELVPVRAGPEALSAVAAGEVDVATTIPDPALYNAFQQRIPLRVVAGASNTIATLIARKELVDSGALKGFADLKGKNLSLPSPVSMHHTWVDIGARKSGIAMSDINLVYLSFPEMMGALAAKRIDAAYLPEPFATNAVEKLGGARWFDPNTVMPGTAVTVWIYSERIAVKEPEIGRKFMVGLLKGARDFLDGTQKGKDRAGVIAALIKHTQVKDPTLYDKMELPAIAANGEIRIDSLRETQDWMNARGSVRVKVDLARIVDTQFTDYAIGKLGRYQ